MLLVIAFTGVGLPGDVSFYVFLVIAFGWYAAMGARLLVLDRAPTGHRVAHPSRGGSTRPAVKVSLRA